MSSTAPTWPALGYERLRIPMAAFEVLGYLAIVAAATLAFLAGWLTVNGAVVLTVALLISLIVLSWAHLGQGRHPVFLFLCTLMFFQGGRLLAYTIRAEPDPMRVRLMAAFPFTTGRTNEGIVLLCLVLSATCIYGVCRWKYFPLRAYDTSAVRRYLPYLYFLFAITLPALVWKNYLYFRYAQNHGGYLAIYQNYAGLAGSAPLPVRIFALFTLPVFVAIFLFEPRRKFVVLVTCLYFPTASLILIMGSRLQIFTLILMLWYVTRVKSARKPRISILLAAVLLLAMIGQLISNLRENTENTDPLAQILVNFVAVQGSSIDVTQLAVKYTDVFAPYIGDYLWNELGESFGGESLGNYKRGRSLASDASVLVNSAGFSSGMGVGGSYIGEAYVLGGISGVVLLSAVIGFGLHLVYRMSGKPLTLLIVALMMPALLYMARGNLLGWLAITIEIAFSWRLSHSGGNCFPSCFSVGVNLGVTTDLCSRNPRKLSG